MSPRPPFVLVVDDLEDNRELYASYFTLEGFSVDHARDGREALAKIEKAKPDLVLMDLEMPGMDGLEATRRLKADPHTRGIVVIVLTGRLSPDDLRDAWAAGADDICPKPFLPEEMVGRIRRVLGIA